MKDKILVFTALALLFFPQQAFSEDTSSALPKAVAYFDNIISGSTVESPLRIEFGITGMEVAPAGTDTPGTGHFHLLIDTQLTPEQMELPIPSDDQHIHYGKGQTEATVNLSPGEHTLQLVMGDSQHMLHKPPVLSEIITVIVK